MNKFKIDATLLMAALFLPCALPAQQPAQPTAYARFRAHNAELRQVQPTWPSPIAEPDPRLGQSLRLSLSNSYTTTHTRTVNYGNWHTLAMPVGNRVQINFMAPPYLQNHSAALPDGFGDPMAEVKYRIVSGNPDHGNYALTAMLAKTWPTGSYENGAATGVFYPTLAGGKMWRRFDLQSSLGGTIPTGKIAAQGQQIAWNTTAQFVADSHLWLELEDNATVNLGGPFDGKMANYLTPGAFYILRRTEWSATHATLLVGAGMQIATSSFYTYNHNLIPEVRILF